MENIKQFGIISMVALIGEIINKAVPLPIPGSVWGMILMFLLLLSGVVNLQQVEKAADFLLGIMAFLFVPLGVGLMTNYQAIQNDLIAISVIVIVSTAIVMIITGLVAQYMQQLNQGKNNK